LVSSLEDDLAGVIAGIPAVDFPNLARDHEPRELRRYGADARIDWDHVRGATRAVSPLALPTRVPRERRFIFARPPARVAGAARPGARAVAALGPLRDPLVRGRSRGGAVEPHDCTVRRRVAAECPRLMGRSLP